MKKIVEQLAKDNGLLHESGKVNYTAFARKCGLPPPTVMRWHKGVTKDVTQQTAEQVAKAFGVTTEQVLGLEPLPGFSKALRGNYEITAADLDFLQKLRQLPTEDQYAISNWIEREAVHG